MGSVRFLSNSGSETPMEGNGYWIYRLEEILY